MSLLTVGRALAASALVAGYVAAEPSPPPVLGGPLVATTGWNSRSLASADLDGDGRKDLILINNDRARIELLYQRRPGEERSRKRPTGLERWQPVLDDAPFRTETVPTGIRAYALAAGDVDGDGDIDLVYTGSPDDLTVRLQADDGSFDQSRVSELDEMAPWDDTLLVRDLDGDGIDDVLVLTRTELAIFGGSEAGVLTGPETSPLGGEDAYALDLVDVNGDGNLDIVHQVAEGRSPLRVRMALADGGYGPEQAFRLGDTLGAIAPVSVGLPSATFVRVNAATGLLELVTTRSGSGTDRELLRSVRPRLIGAGVEGTAPATWAVTDLDGDGRRDLVVADARGAVLRVRLQRSPGALGEPEEFPSLADVRSMSAADLDGDGRSELILASRREEVLGWTGLDDEGRLRFPYPLPAVGTPHAVTAADLDGDGRPEVAASVEGDGTTELVILDRPSADAPWTVERLPLDDVRTVPHHLATADANQDGRLDLLAFVRHEPARLLLQSADGAFSEAALESGYLRGLLDDVSPSAFTVGDVDGDGRAEMLVARDGFVRALRVSSDGALQVLDQYNARARDTDVAAAAVLDLDGDGDREIVLIHEGDGGLEVLQKRRGMYRSVEHAPLEGVRLERAEVVDLTGDGREDLLLLDERRAVWLPIGSEDLELEVLARYETDLEDVSYDLVAAGDLDADGSDDVVAIDARDSRVLEVLRVDSEDGFRSLLHFAVFEVDPYYEGQRGNPAEPRQALVVDVTGDGRDDIVLLVHDRVLVYPQE